MIDVDAAIAYLGFVEARHQVWERRQAGEPAPWTDDPVVRAHKFTNVFRVLDFGSQFLVKELLDPQLPPRDVLMRCFLYRHTGRPEAWEYLKFDMGEYPRAEALDDVLESWKSYRGQGVTSRKGPNSKGGYQSTSFEKPVFTGAYLVFPQSQVRGTDKLESIIDLTKRLFTPGSPQDVVPDFLAAGSQKERFEALRRNKGVADFMSMQVLTDWGYSDQCGEDREDEFVVLGPGARRGAAALDPTGDVDATFRWAVEAVRGMPGCPRLGGRQPSWMDIQNTLCEFSKYVRFASKPSREKQYQPAHPGLQSTPALPAHW